MSAAAEPCSPEAKAADEIGRQSEQSPSKAGSGAAKTKPGGSATRGKPARPAVTVSVGQILQLACWIGLVVGLSEAAYFAVLKLAFGEIIFEGNRLFWICPAMQAATFLALAMPFALGAVATRRRVSLAAVTGSFVFVGAMNALLLFHGLHTLARVLLAGGIAVQACRLAGRHGPWMVRTARRTLVFPVLVVLGIIAVVETVRWTAGSRALANLPPARPAAPNVVLIVLDTVRYDSLDLGGSPTHGKLCAETPDLRRLAGESVVFDQAIAPAPWTLPSHATMFTGRHGHEHGADWHRGLDGTYPTLAERLSQQGYLTAGFVGNTWYCGAETGLARGFAHYDDYRLTLERFLQSTALGRHLVASEWPWQPTNLVDRKNAEAVGGPFLAWVDRARKDHPDRPFFAFLNYFDAHDPYIAPPDFARLSPATDEERHFMLHFCAAEKLDLTDRELELCRTGYVDCIAYLDHHLGRLFAEMERRGLMENTILIVTSDHGEHFGDHDLYGHGNSLYQAALHVPLVFHFPGRIPEGRRVDAMVGLDELPATVIDLVGGRSGGVGENAAGRGAESPFPGRSLRRFWERPEAETADLESPTLAQVNGPGPVPPCDGRSPVFRGPMKAVTSGRFKYIRTGDEEELYDVVRDPAETSDLSSIPQFRTTLGQLRASLDRLIEGTAP